MKQYFKVMLGRKSCMAEECHKQGYIGTGFLHQIDLLDSLYDYWRDFNKKSIPPFIRENPDKSKVAAGLSCAYPIPSFEGAFS